MIWITQEKAPPAPDQTGCTERNCFLYTRMVRLKPAAPLAGRRWASRWLCLPSLTPILTEAGALAHTEAAVGVA